MQDLFQLGNILQGDGTTSESERSAHRTRESKEEGPSTEAPDFETLLAIVASLAQTTPGETFQAPTTDDLSTRNIDALVGPAAQCDTNATDIRDLLGAFNQPSSKISETDATAVEAEESGSPVAFEYRPVSRSIPVSIAHTDTRQGFERSMTSPDVSAKSGQVRLMDQVDRSQSSNADGHPLDVNRQTEAELERLLRWHNKPAPAGAARPTPDSGVLVAPELRVVARNDNPLRFPTRNIPPVLRIVENGPEMAEMQAGDDLIDRLADTWESSFIPANEDTFLGDHSLDPMPDMLNHPALAEQYLAAVGATGEPALRLMGRQNGTVASLSDDDEMAEAEIDGDDGFGRALRDGFAYVEDALPTACDFAGLNAGNATDRRWSHSTAVDDPSIQISPAPIPLFSEFLPVELEPANSSSREPAISARQAVMEISRELRHVEATGGSELSFRLRLHPEHLGEIEIGIQRTNDVWSISITAAHEETRDVLAAEISLLEHRFRKHHLNLNPVTVVTKAP